MNRKLFGLAVFLALATVPACARTSYPAGFQVDVLVDGRHVPVYFGHGLRYVEAIKGKKYSIRLRNPLGVRVAVALSVDGLNTIDARHTDPRSAQKWVLGPHETITISGWQTGMKNARRFFFTSEEQSYGAWLGKRQNLGIISAVYFREKRRPKAPRPVVPKEKSRRDGPSAAPEAGASRDSAERSSKAESPSGNVREEDYAATGIGRRYGHRVYRVRMDLEEKPAATVNIRYEYRTQLVRLGLLPPSSAPYPDPLARRQSARGFKPGFCPEPR